MMFKSVVVVLFSILIFQVDFYQASNIGGDFLEDHEVYIKSRIDEIAKFSLPMPPDALSKFLDLTASRYVPVQAESLECRNHSHYLLRSVMQGDMWALRMLDASSKLVSGVLDGHLKDLGNYEQCINVEEPGHTFQGQHCVFATSGLIFNQGTNVKAALESDIIYASEALFSICVPSSCSEEDVSSHINSVLAPLHASTESSLITCTTKHRPSYRTKDLIAMAIFTYLSLPILLEKYFGHRSSLLSSFSLTKNVRDLMNTQTPSGDISCMNGLRVILVLLVMFHHRFSFIFTMPSQRQFTLFEQFGTTKMGIVEFLPLMMNTFFLMSGTVLTYSCLRHKENGTSFNTVKFYIKRYFRLTPVLAVVMLFNATLLVHASHGPIWAPFIKPVEKYCVDNWWAGLLHITNYAEPGQVCVGQSWYVACDFQLHLVAPLMLVPLLRKPRAGLLLMSVLFLATVGSSVVNAYMKNYSTGYIASIFYTDKVTDAVDHPSDYTGFHFRLVPFIMGMFLGYQIFHANDQEKTSISMSKCEVGAGWTLFVVVVVSLVTTTVFIADPAHQYCPWLDPLVFALSPVVYSGCLWWLIYACHFGHGGIVNDVLSWPGFRPLARLVYCAYLVHCNIQYVQEGSMQVPTAFSYKDPLFLVMGDAVYSFFIAAILYVHVEVPVSRVVNHLLKDEKKPLVKGLKMGQ